MDSVIKCEELWKTYRTDGLEASALKDVNLKINKGDIMAIMGPSGSGKSTLLHILGCLDKPTKGLLLIDGKDVSRMNDDQLARIRREKLGFVFQFFHLIPSLTTLGNVMLPMSFAGVAGEQQNKRATELLEMVGLGHRLQHRPNELSGGERQRAAIARAMANKPAIILADEPTGNLDSKTGAGILELLRDICDRENQTVIIVTHDFRAASYADRVLVLRDGRIRGEAKIKGAADTHRALNQLLELELQ